MEQRLTFDIRPATPADLPALIALEQATFGNDGVEPYGEDHFRAWLRTHQPGFLVACHDGRLGGYLYSQLLHFDPFSPPPGLTYSDLTDDGFTERSHDPTGRCFHAVSAASVIKGAGRSLMNAGLRLAADSGRRSYFCLSRISGYSAWLDRHPGLAASAERDPAFDEALASWYVRQNVGLLQGSMRPSVAVGGDLPLPPVDLADPVLSCHLRVKGLDLVRILPRCMHDPKSRDFAALLATRLDRLPETSRKLPPASRSLRRTGLCEAVMA